MVMECGDGGGEEDRILKGGCRSLVSAVAGREG